MPWDEWGVGGERTKQCAVLIAFRQRWFCNPHSTSLKQIGPPGMKRDQKRLLSVMRQQGNVQE